MFALRALAAILPIDRTLLRGRLFNNSEIPSATDVQQGFAEHCYFVAAVQTVAQQFPEPLHAALIRTPISVSTDSTEATCCVAAPTLSLFAGVHLTLGPRNSVLWPALLSDAFAHKFGASALIDRGSVEVALRWLLGCRVCSRQDFVRTDIRVLVDELAQLFMDGECIVAQTAAHHALALTGAYRGASSRVSLKFIDPLLRPNAHRYRWLHSDDATSWVFAVTFTLGAREEVAVHGGLMFDRLPALR